MSRGGYRGGSTVIRVADLARAVPQPEPTPIETVRLIQDEAKAANSTKDKRLKNDAKLRASLQKLANEGAFDDEEW